MLLQSIEIALTVAYQYNSLIGKAHLKTDPDVCAFMLELNTVTVTLQMSTNSFRIMFLGRQLNSSSQQDYRVTPVTPK